MQLSQLVRLLEYHYKAALSTAKVFRASTSFPCKFLTVYHFDLFVSTHLFITVMHWHFHPLVSLEHLTLQHYLINLIQFTSLLLGYAKTKATKRFVVAIYWYHH